MCVIMCGHCEYSMLDLNRMLLLRCCVTVKLGSQNLCLPDSAWPACRGAAAAAAARLGAQLRQLNCCCSALPWLSEVMHIQEIWLLLTGSGLGRPNPVRQPAHGVYRYIYTLRSLKYHVVRIGMTYW